MKNLFLISLLTFVLTSSLALNAQQAEQEKLLLTLDRTNYVPGDYVWFSGYILSGTNNTLLGNEFILHVCLYDPNGELTNHNLFLINKGTFKGHIELPKQAKKGLYRIVAYTNWMRNWGNSMLYQKLIWVNGEKSDLNFSSTYNWIKSESTDTLVVSLKMDKSQQTDLSFLNVSSKLQTAKGKPILENQLTSEEAFQLAFPIKKGAIKDSLKLKIEVADETSTISKHLLIRTTKLKPDVQFLPESGNLLSGLNQRIAFKAIAENGFPTNISGVIYDQNRHEVAQLTTIHDGMGSFDLIPQKGNSYHAVISTDEGNTYEYKLPLPQSNGVIIRAQQVQNIWKLKIYGSQSSQPLKLKVHHNGQVLSEHSVKKLPSKTFQFDNSTLPTGITHFTLVNNDNIPLCERVVFKAPTSPVNVSFPMDKINFTERDSILLPIEVSNLNTNQLALFSVSVFDKNFYNNYIGGNAITELLLTSELPGFIGNPTYYLQQTEEAKEAADLLMLTNGWSRFNWKEISASADEMPYERESNIYLKGQIRHILTNKPLKNNYAQGLFYAPGQSIRKTSISNDKGDFIFEFPDIDYNLKTNLKFAAKDGAKPRDVRATIESLKEIQEIDMVKANMVTSTINKAPKMPLIESAHLKLDNAPDKSLTQYIPHKPRKDNYFSVGMDTIVLNELEVSKSRILNARENMRAMFGTPKKVITSKQILSVADDISWYTSTWDLLKLLYPELDIQRYLSNLVTENYNFTYGIQHIKHPSKPVLVVLNGRRIYAHENPYLTDEIPDLQNQLERFKNINPKQITSVELFDTKDNFNKYLNDYETFLISYTYDDENPNNDLLMSNKPSLPPYILSITTTGGFASWSNDRQSQLQAEVHGFEALKSPYAPKYNVPEADSIIFDGRKTLYWNPIIVAKNGVTKKINFYSGDTEGEKQIQVNGVTSDGIPFYGETSIQVKNSLNTLANLNPDQTKRIAIIDRFTKATKKHITTDLVTIRCIDEAAKSPIANLLLTYKNNQYLATNTEGEAILDKRLGTSITLTAIGYKNKTLQLNELTSDSALVSLEPVSVSKSQIVKSANNLVRSAITVSARQMPKDQIRKSFFREKVYENDYLVSLEDWELESKLFSYGLYRDEGEVRFVKGKSYRTFDYREKIKATPNRRDNYFPYTADPMYIRKPFLDLMHIKYYNYSVTGETVLDNTACIEILFDVKPELYMPGYRGKLAIDKTSHMIMCVEYVISPTNREYLDDSYFIHDNPGRFDIELQKASYYVRYNTELNNFYPIVTKEKIDFTVNKLNKQTFIRETLFNSVTTSNNFNARSDIEAERETYLVKNPMYDKVLFQEINTIKLPNSDFIEIPFLHEISKFK